MCQIVTREEKSSRNAKTRQTQEVAKYRVEDLRLQATPEAQRL